MNPAHVATEYLGVAEYLFGLKPTGAKFGIDRMRLLAAALGHPEKNVPCVHVAGTNGKGSVSAMLEAIFRAAGWHTGLYTSPHLVRLGERVQVDRQILSEREIVEYVRELTPVCDRLASEHPDDRPSFFEIMTAMAFLQFIRAKCDLAVFEVGLGGELDATNIVTPEVSVITSIGRDHEEYLGNEIEKIAAAKAGIIKVGVPVVIGRLPAEAECVVREIADEKHARVISVRDEFGDDLAKYPRTNLEGDYQRWNAATAVLATRALNEKWKISEAAIERGLREVAWPGRWQRLQIDGRLLVLDASHNVDGAQVLAANLAALVAETGKLPVVIVGVLGLDRARSLIEVICRYAREIHFVVPNQPRACTHAELTALVASGFRGKVVRAFVPQLFPSAGVCTAGGKDDGVVVTGSIYLLGEVISRLAVDLSHA